jgi:FAD-linked sulfhydryl oxidase
MNNANNTAEDDCSGCDALGVFKQMTAGLPNKGSNNKANNKTGSDTPKKTNNNETKKTNVSEKLDEFWEKESPPDIIELGRSGWTVLHSVAAYFPEKPTEDNKKDATNFLNGFARLFPCKVCAKDFQEVLERHPPKLDNRKEFNVWMCEAHNEVNQKLGKPLFDCSTIEDRWKAAVKQHGSQQ